MTDKLNDDAMSGTKCPLDSSKGACEKQTVFMDNAMSHADAFRTWENTLTAMGSGKSPVDLKDFFQNVRKYSLNMPNLPGMTECDNCEHAITVLSSENRNFMKKVFGPQLSGVVRDDDLNKQEK